jgi:tetratricopeptide (TPR) repeat protein
MERRDMRIIIFVLIALGFGLMSISEAGMSEGSSLVEQYLRETSQSPRSVEAWTSLSSAYLRRSYETDGLHQMALAESAAVRALEVDSLSIGALMQYSRVAAAQRRFEDVLPVQRQVLLREPRDALAWGILGDAFWDLGKYRSADSCYFVMYEMDPGFHSLFRVARREFDIGDFKKGVKYLRDAIDAAKDSDATDWELADVHLRLGEAYLDRGEWKKALRSADRALEFAPDRLAGLSLKANVLRLQGRLDESVRLSRALARQSEHPRHNAALARCLAAAGDREATDSLLQVAARTYEALSKEFPGVVTRDRIEFLLEWNMELGQALAIAYKESRAHRDYYAYELLAWAFYKNGKHDTAWSSVALALRRGVVHPRLLYRAAVIAKAAGKEDKFESFAKRARKANPHYREMYGPL